MSRRSVKIGVITPKTGGSAYFGNVMERGIRLAIEEREEESGSAIRPQLILIDDQSKLDLAKDAVLQLVADGVVAILGPMDTDSAAVASEIARDRGIALISPAATGAYLTDGDNIWFFRAHTSDRERVQQLGKWMMAEHSGQSLLLVSEQRTRAEAEAGANLSYGEAMAADLKSYLRKADQPFFEVHYPRDADDKELRAFIEQGLKGTPDAAAILGRSAQCAILGQALRRSLPRLPLFVVSPGKGDFASKFRSDVYAVTDTLTETVNFEALTSFRQRYRNTFPGTTDTEVIDQYATFCYDATNIVCDAVETLAGRAELWTDLGELRAAVRTAIEATGPGRRGVITQGGFTPNRELVFVPHRQRLVNHEWSEVPTTRSDGRPVSYKRQATLRHRLTGAMEAAVRHVDSHWLYKASAIVAGLIGLVALIVQAAKTLFG